jgi:branched-chain amino acid transport system ATP-binding protein
LPVLRVSKLSLAYGGVEALKELDLELDAGTVLGLVGPNGSGKTTLFDAITGAPIDGGRIEFDGCDITHRSTARIARLGVARTFQTPRLFGRLSVLENAGSADALAQVGLARRASELAEALTLPERRRLELARALARAPRLLLLDEPLGGLGQEDAEALLPLIAAARAPGRAIILIEHVPQLIERLCDRVLVLDAGRKAAEGVPAAILADPAVRALWLGTRYKSRS